MKKLSIMILVLLLFIVGCVQNGNPEEGFTRNPHSDTRFMLNTVSTVRIFNEDKEEVLDQVFAHIKSYENILTMHEAGSEIDEVNQNAGIKPVKVSEEVFNLVELSIEHAQLSEGLFDVSIGVLTSLWNIGSSDARKPSQAEIDEVLPLVGYEKIELHREDLTIFLQEKGMKIDLGGIAKGYIVDKAAEFLVEHGVTAAVIDLGGDIFVVGNNIHGNPWNIGVQNPFLGRGQIIGTVKAVNQSIVTSGVYERVFEEDGVDYHHLLNPFDGYPFMNDLAGVSIVSETSAEGDALSTAAFGMGLEKGLEFIEAYEGAEAVFIGYDRKIYITSGLEEKFTVTNENYELVVHSPK